MSSDRLGDRLWQYFREGPPADAAFPELFLASFFWWGLWAFLAVAAATNIVLLVTDSLVAGYVVATLGVGSLSLALTK